MRTHARYPSGFFSYQTGCFAQFTRPFAQIFSLGGELETALNGFPVTGIIAPRTIRL
ncbi:MAG TPA: hypothetical protein VF435_07445 [Pyrinomonadaceae bacterium]